MKKVRKNIIFFSMFIFGVLFLVSPLFAQTTDQNKVELIEPNLQINIPTVQFSKATAVGGVANIPYLAEYIAGIFRYAMAIVGIVAVVMIMIGGLQWLTAGGSADRVKSAKERISGAVIGLIIALGTYTVLYSINPDLVNFSELNIKLVSRQDILTDFSETAYESSGIANSDSSLQLIKGDNMLRVSKDAKAIGSLVTIFQKVASDLESKSCIIASASGARSGQTQLKLTKKYCTWSDSYKTYINCKPAVGRWGSTTSQPKSTTCKYTDRDTPISPCNVNGWLHDKAIDAFAVELTTKKSSSGGLRCYGSSGCIQERCQKELISAMNQSGACVLLGRAKSPSNSAFEPWHFEIASGSNSEYCFTNAIQIFNSL